MRIPDAFLTDLRQRIDLVDVVSEYVTLRRAGRNFIGLCPFHNERTPSFSVSSERQFFHCFGCGASGNVIQFVMDIEGLSFPDAVKATATRVGIELPFTGITDERPSSDGASRRQPMKDAHELAAKWYSYILMNSGAGVQALKYLETRRYSKQTIVQFRLGYAPDTTQGVVQFLQQRGFDMDTLIDSGLAVAYGNQTVDRFRSRVMIPIVDAQGAVVAFGGRALNDGTKPKYLNSPETPIFHKSRILFNHHQARKAIRAERTAILMEGYMDVISASQAGVHHVVASLGTSFSNEQATLLKRHCEKLIIAYDGDNAGVTAARKALSEASLAGHTCQVLTLPDGEDPDDYIRKYGSEAFQQHLASSTLTPVQFLIYELHRNAELRSVADQQSYIRSVLLILADGATPIEVETEIRKLSMDFQVTVDSLKEEFSRIAKNLVSPSKRRSQAQSPGPPQMVTTAKGHVLAGQRVLYAIMTDLKSYEYLIQRGFDELVVAEHTALLALCYGFRASYSEADVSSFVESIQDEELRRLAIAILMMDDAPAPTPEIIEDYIRTIETERIMEKWRVTIEEWKEAERRQDPEAIVHSKSSMDALTAELQRLKSPPQQVHSG